METENKNIIYINELNKESYKEINTIATKLGYSKERANFFQEEIIYYELELASLMEERNLKSVGIEALNIKLTYTPAKSVVKEVYTNIIKNFTPEETAIYMVATKVVNWEPDMELIKNVFKPEIIESTRKPSFRTTEITKIIN